MLSSEGSTLTRLILARHILICRAIESDAHFEVLELIESAQGVRSDSHPRTMARGLFIQSQNRLLAELVLLPALVDDLEGQIERAWRRLDRVSPRIAD